MTTTELFDKDKEQFEQNMPFSQESGTTEISMEVMIIILKKICDFPGCKIKRIEFFSHVFGNKNKYFEMESQNRDKKSNKKRGNQARGYFGGSGFKKIWQDKREKK